MALAATLAWKSCVPGGAGGSSGTSGTRIAGDECGAWSAWHEFTHRVPSFGDNAVSSQSWTKLIGGLAHPALGVRRDGALTYSLSPSRA